MLSNVANLKKCRFAWPTLVVLCCASCSSGLENQQDMALRPAKRAPKARFKSPEMDAMYKAAKASPRSFEPVYAYTKAVADACLASLADTSCQTCGEGAMRFKRRSELEPQFWPIIEEAVSMLDVLGKTLELTAPEQVDLMLATKGRLLWLAGRSVEEQPMIDEYAQEHPDAPAVVRRRLELLRESGNAAGVEAQCKLSRAKAESAPEAARVDILTACVALNPRNTQGRSDLLDYAKFLPGLTNAEENLYRKNLVERCEARAGDDEGSCAAGCACDDPQLAGKCKRACSRCRSETTQRLRLCRKITDAPSAVVRAPRPAPAPAQLPPSLRSSPASDAPRPKRDTGKGLKPVEL